MIRLLPHNKSAFEPGTPIGPAVWPHFDLLFVHSGRIHLRMRAREALTLTGGDALLIYPQTRFEGVCVKRSCFSVQHFALREGAHGEPWVDLRHRRRGFEWFERRQAPRLRADVDRAMDLARRQQTPLVQQMRVAVLTLELGQLRSQAPAVLSGLPHGLAFEPLIRWVQDRLDQPITIADMAKQLDLSPSHFRALFREQVGLSAGRFLLNLRLSEARRLLRETSLPIKQIARLVGFASVISFAHSFKKHARRTPAAYRRHPGDDRSGMAGKHRGPAALLSRRSRRLAPQPISCPT